METAKQKCLVENREILLDLNRKIYLDFYHLKNIYKNGENEWQKKKKLRMIIKRKITRS